MAQQRADPPGAADDRPVPPRSGAVPLQHAPPGVPADGAAPAAASLEGDSPGTPSASGTGEQRRGRTRGLRPARLTRRQRDPDTPRSRGGKAAVPPPGAVTRGRRGTLNRAVILGAAVLCIDRQGLRALTMGRVAGELGVEAMALYRYVPSREALLDGVVETVVDELYGDPDVHLAPKDGWQDYLQRLAHGVRRIALAHPEVFPLVATRPPAAPWIRPPLRSLRWVEAFLAALLSRGFTEAGAVAAYRAFSSFLLGHLLLEVSAHGVDTGPVDEPDPPSDASAAAAAAQVVPGLADQPNLLRLAPQLAEDHFAAEFDESLTNLLARLAEYRTLSRD